MEHPITPPTELVAQWLKQFYGPATRLGTLAPGEASLHVAAAAAQWGWEQRAAAAPTPNDLSHLSDKEFIALCPQGYHAPGPAPLSPAAQALLDAAVLPCTIRQGIAAAIRALADQLRLELPLGDTDADAGVFAAHQAITVAILAIATELEGHG